jgi:Xaa-Pro dipeptidase
MKADRALVLEELANKGVSGAVFTDPASVLYLSGYCDPGDVGFPFVGLPAAVVVGESADVLLVPNVRRGEAESLADGLVLTYEVYDYTRAPTPAAETFVAALEEALHIAGASTGDLGYEPLRGPSAIHQLRRSLVDVSGVLTTLRAIKRLDEVDAVRAAAKLADVAHARIRELVAPGVPEIELFAQARAAMEIAAGERIQAAGDLVSGTRAETVGEGQPSSAPVQRGSTVIADVIPVLRGYFVDTCMAYPVGRPSSKLHGLFDIVVDALEVGSAHARPGISGGELDAIVRGRVKAHGYDYAHHTGHGLGTTRWEEPFVLPGSSSILQAGMILALEPGIYEPGVGGVRVEHTMLVTGARPEVLTNHTMDGAFA